MIISRDLSTRCRCSGLSVGLRNVGCRLRQRRLCRLVCLRIGIRLLLRRSSIGSWLLRLIWIELRRVRLLRLPIGMLRQLIAHWSRLRLMWQRLT